MKKSADFARIFRANFTENQSLKKQLKLNEFSGQILLEIDKFCTHYSESTPTLAQTGNCKCLFCCCVASGRPYESGTNTLVLYIL